MLYTPKEYIAKVQFFIIKRPKVFPKTPARYGPFDSLSGNFQDLVIVGNAARPSLKMANKIEMFKSFVII